MCAMEREQEEEEVNERRNEREILRPVKFPNTIS